MSFGLTVSGTACIVFPIPSVSPGKQTGIIDDSTLESLIGLQEKEVIAQLGLPDFAGPRDETYLMVYEGEKQYSTDVHVASVLGGGASTMEGSIVLVCHLIELDSNHMVSNFEIKEQVATIPRTDNAQHNIESIRDCSGVGWKSDQREGVLTKIAILKKQADSGNRATAFILAYDYSDPTYVKELAQIGDRDAAFLIARKYNDPTYVKRLAQKGDKEAAFLVVRKFNDPTYVKELAQKGDREAAFILAARYRDPSGLRVLASHGDETAAVKLASEFQDLTALRGLAEQGDVDAAHLLAIDFNDLAPLKELAKRGNREAAKELVKLTGKSFGPLEKLAENGDLAAAVFIARNAKELKPLISLAKTRDSEAARILEDEFNVYIFLERDAEIGDSSAAYELYQRLRKRRNSTVDAWRWLCFAANSGYANAQAEIGSWFRSTTWEIWKDWNENSIDLLRYIGVEPDNQIAYMWYTLAISNGDKSALTVRDCCITRKLSNNEIARANLMAREWKPGDCPSAHSRLPTTADFVGAMERKGWAKRKVYKNIKDKKFVEAITVLKYQQQKGKISDEEYMRKQREVVNRLAGKTR